MSTAEYRQSLDTLPYCKRLPGAVYLLDPGEDPREADLIKIHLHSRKLTFHYYRDFDTTPLPELLTRIKIDLKRLFVTVIDHTNGAEHQLLFFKERFLAKMCLICSLDPGLCHLDPDLFACLQDADFRRDARRTLVGIYFTPTEQVMLCARLGLPAPKTEAIAALRADAAAFKAIQKKAATAASRATCSADTISPAPSPATGSTPNNPTKPEGF